MSNLADFYILVTYLCMSLNIVLSTRGNNNNGNNDDDDDDSRKSLLPEG